MNDLSLILDAIAEHWGERCGDMDHECEKCRAWKAYDRIAALDEQLAVARKALEEISEPETVWRRRAAEDGIRLAAADIVDLMRQRTPEIIARTALRKLERTALRKLGGRNVD